MKVRLIALFVVGAFAGSSVAVQQELVNLRLNVEVGQVFNFQTYSEVTYKRSSGKNDESSFCRQTSKNQLTVVSRSEDQYELSTWNHDIFYQLANAQEVRGVDSTVVVTQKSNGTLLDLRSDTNGNDEKFKRNPNHFLYPSQPVTVGSRWQKHSPADSLLGTPEMTINYVIADRRMWKGFDVFIIRFSNSKGDETPMPMSGTTYVEVTTGLGVFTEAHFENLTDPSLQVRSTYRMEYVRE